MVICLLPVFATFNTRQSILQMDQTAQLLQLRLTCFEAINLGFPVLSLSFRLVGFTWQTYPFPVEKPLQRCLQPWTQCILSHCMLSLAAFSASQHLQSLSSGKWKCPGLQLFTNHFDSGLYITQHYLNFSSIGFPPYFIVMADMLYV